MISEVYCARTGRYLGRRFCKQFSEGSPYFPGQQGSCKTTMQLSENILQNLLPKIQHVLVVKGYQLTKFNMTLLVNMLHSVESDITFRSRGALSSGSGSVSDLVRGSLLVK